MTKKELSIEEKAKRYDEAIKKAKYYFDEGKTLEYAIDIVSNIFPELAESKDEKIRKEIIATIHLYYGESLENEAKEMIAWLEKQGEQKPVYKIQLGKKYRCIASPRYSTFMVGGIYKPKDKFLCSLMNFCSDCFEPIEDGEQKPADLPNGEDYGIDGLYHAISILEKTLGKVDGYQSDDGILEHKCAITAVKKLYNQKPAEWSEEDETMLERVIKFIPQCMTAHGYNEYINWLKSLKDRYTWKPSERQKEALLWCVVHLGGADKQTLGELLEALNKL